MQQIQKHTAIPISAAAALVAIGVVYGDIGTSPMYVMKSIMAGNGGLAAPHCWQMGCLPPPLP